VSRGNFYPKHSPPARVSQHFFLCVSTMFALVLMMFRNMKNVFLYYSRFGRKRTIIAYSILSGICVVAVSLIPHGTGSIGTSYMKHERSCLTTFSNAEKRVENTTLSLVFPTYYKVFGNVVKHCLEYFIYLLNRN